MQGIQRAVTMKKIIFMLIKPDRNMVILQTPVTELLPRQKGLTTQNKYHKIHEGNRNG